MMPGGKEYSPSLVVQVLGGGMPDEMGVDYAEMESEMVGDLLTAIKEENTDAVAELLRYLHKSWHQHEDDSGEM